VGQAVAGLIKSEPNRWEDYAFAGAITASVHKVSEAKVAYNRALTLASEADKPRIREAIRRVEGEATYDSQLMGAIKLANAGRVGKAAQAVTGLIKSDPHRWEGYALAGAIAEEINQVMQAKVLYNRGLSLAPDADKPLIREAIQRIEPEGRP
jgi:Flp pilus assembly protein TadD